MGFGREVDHHVGMFFLKKSVQGLPVADVRLYKAEIRVVHDRRQGGKVARIGQLVQADDPIVRMCPQHVENKVASDKSGAAGHNNSHFFSFCLNVRSRDSGLYSLSRYAFRASSPSSIVFLPIP